MEPGAVVQDMVFQGRLRFADAEGAQRATDRLDQVGVLAGHVVRVGPAVEVDAQAVADAGEYPDVIAVLDDVADEAIGGSITARLGGQPSDWVGAAAPVAGLEGLSTEAQDLLRACIGCDADTVRAGRDEVAANEALTADLVAGWRLLDEDDQRASFVLLVGSRRDEALAPIMRAGLALSPGEDLHDIARHLAVGYFLGTEAPGFDWTDREAVAAAIARLQGSAPS